MVSVAGLRLRLAAQNCRTKPRLAALHDRSLGLHRLRLDVDLIRVIRLGYLSLRSLGAVAQQRMVLDSRQSVGSGLGLLEIEC